ncbi:MAG: serine/threonine protein [Planctomycetota bacterium]|nr:MAG: serine/threonine protein [Planctomycetota bacterium]
MPDFSTTCAGPKKGVRPWSERAPGWPLTSTIGLRERNLREVQTGDRIGEYVLREKLGEGGFGVVWKAENPDLPGKVVAIKFPAVDGAHGTLRVEAAAQHKLQHPRIVRTLSVNLQHDPPYVVLEYVAGQSLRERLRIGGTLIEREMLAVANDVLEASAFAHARDIVHGDISPSNVIIDLQGRACVTDFGLSRDLSPQEDPMSLSRSSAGSNQNRIQGTLAYLAPELRNGGSKSKESDVFALGILLLEMATGDPSYLRFPVDGAPRWLSGLVERATHRSPEKRYPAAVEMLGAFIEETGHQARAASPQPPNRGSEPRIAETQTGVALTHQGFLVKVTLLAVGLAVLTTVAIAVRVIRSRRSATPAAMAEARQPAVRAEEKPKPTSERPTFDAETWGKETSEGTSLDQMLYRAEWKAARTERWRRLHKGMSQDEVRELLGEPRRIEMGLSEFWSYSDAGCIFFHGSSLESWSEPR